MAIITQPLRPQPFDLGQAQTQRRNNRLNDLAIQQRQDFNALAPQRAAAVNMGLEQGRYNFEQQQKTDKLKQDFREANAVKGALGFMLKNAHVMEQDPRAYQMMLQKLQERGIDTTGLKPQFDPNEVQRMLEMTNAFLPHIAAQLHNIPAGGMAVDQATGRVIRNPKDPKQSTLRLNLIEAGYKPGTPEYEAAARAYMAKSPGGSNTTNNITLPGPKNVATTFDEYAADIKERRPRMAQLRTAARLVRNIETGTGAQTKQWFRKVGQTFGFPVDDQLIADTEAFANTTMKFVMDWVSQTKGAISEKEMTAFEAASPNITNSKLGNQIIIKLGMEALRRDDLIDREMQDWLSQNPNASRVDVYNQEQAAVAKWQAVPVYDIFSPAERQVLEGAIAPEDKASPITDPGRDAIEAEMKKRGLKLD